jgi:hypothetical protein
MPSGAARFLVIITYWSGKSRIQTSNVYGILEIPGHSLLKSFLSVIGVDVMKFIEMRSVEHAQ